MYSNPLAYLLTWTCHGTWLHGDERGSVDDNRNGYNTPTIRPSVRMLRDKKMALAQAPRTLTPAERTTVGAAIDAHCAIRRWTVLAKNPRSNHVHAVIAAPGIDPDKVLKELKSWSTRFLRRTDPTFTKPWTSGGSTRYLFAQEDVDAAIHYVMAEQDRLERFVLPSERKRVDRCMASSRSQPTFGRASRSCSRTRLL
ncbi:MAG: transposase [Phycisphaerales bacterium]